MRTTGACCALAAVAAASTQDLMRRSRASRARNAPRRGGLVPAAEPVNVFFAVDSPYYLAMVACAMRAAHERTAGRTYRFFILWRAPLTAKEICAAGKLAIGSLYEGCASFTHTSSTTSCAVGHQTLSTINTIELKTVPRVLDGIYRLTTKDFESRTRGDCTNRGDLVNLFNLAPDAMDQFLLPLGVTRAAYLDADAWPDKDFLRFYDTDADIVVALARRRKRCVQAGATKWERKNGLSGANWSEGFHQELPYVSSRLGRTLHDLDQVRWRADCFHVPDLQRYCAYGVPERVLDALKKQTHGGGSQLWTCGVQQPPLLLALANHTSILRRDDLAVVGPGVEACQERNPEISVHSENKNSLLTRTMRKAGGDRNVALATLLKRLAAGDAQACGARRTKVS